MMDGLSALDEADPDAALDGLHDHIEDHRDARKILKALPANLREDAALKDVVHAVNGILDVLRGWASFALREPRQPKSGGSGGSGVMEALKAIAADVVREQLAGADGVEVLKTPFGGTLLRGLRDAAGSGCGGGAMPAERVGLTAQLRLLSDGNYDVSGHLIEQEWGTLTLENGVPISWVPGGWETVVEFTDACP